MVHSQPVAQVRRQCGVQRLAGAQQRVVDVVAGAAAADFFQVGRERRQVSFAQRPRVAAELLGQFQALEPRRPVEGEIQLVVVQEKSRKPYVLVTSDLHVPAKGVIASYKRRWRVEVTIREEKQGLNLEGFRVRSLAAVIAHINLVFLAHTLLRVIVQIDEALIGKSIGSIKRELVNVIAIVTRVLKKIGVEFLDDFGFFYLLELVKCRERRRNGHASARG